MYIDIYIYVCMYIYIHICIYIYMYIYMVYGHKDFLLYTCCNNPYEHGVMIVPAGLYSIFWAEKSVPSRRYDSYSHSISTNC